MDSHAPLNKILIIGPAWVGDMVMAQSLLIALKARDPGSAIDVVAPAWTFPLLERMPQVRRAVALDLGHGELGLRARRRLGVALRAERYRWAIVLPNSYKSALVPWFARVPVRSGYVGELRYGLLNDARRLDKTRLYRMHDRYLALGLAQDTPLHDPPAPQLRARDTQARATSAALKLDRARAPVLALCPGAEYGPAKRWPAGHFAHVARAKLAQGWQVWLLGSAKDAEVTRKIKAGVADPRCVDLAGRTTLAQAIDLLSLADAVVSNDSGLMHVAAALNRPLVALFGSSDPRHTPPLGARAQALSLGLGCSPCFARDCPLGHTRCLHELPAERVLAALP